MKIDNAPVIKKTKAVTELNEKIILEKKKTKLEEKKAEKIKKETPKKKKALTITEAIDETILKLKAQWLTHIELDAIKPIIMGIVK